MGVSIICFKFLFFLSFAVVKEMLLWGKGDLILRGRKLSLQEDPLNAEPGNATASLTASLTQPPIQPQEQIHCLG